MRHRGGLPSSSYALLALSGATPDHTAFGERGGRVGGALGTAVATHALIALALWSEPVARLRTRGAEALAIPASSSPTLATPETITPESAPTLTVPVQPMNAGELPQFGAVEGVPGPPTSSRGPGDSGVGARPGSDRAGLGNGTDGPGVGDGSGGTGAGVSPPTLIYRALPQYTPEAMRAKLQGVAYLTGVVGVDGTLHDIRIVRSLDAAFGLDQEAIKCVRQWRFKPASRQGKPVAVFVNLEVAFNLR
jgi:TonB family protein